MVTFEKTIKIVDIKLKTKKTFDKINASMDSIETKLKKDDTTYNKCEGKDLKKRIARQKVSEAIINSGESGLMLSLTSNKNVDTEKEILKHLPDMKIVAVENKINIVSDMRTMFKEHNLKMSVFVGDVSQKLYGANEDTYAHLNLDYCSNIITIAKELKYVLDNKLVRKNGIIAVTIYKPIRRIKNNKSFLDVLKLFKTNFEGDSRNNINKVIERFFYAICGFNYSVELFEYKDTSPMVLALIKREI
jgi:hypothetical protein